MLIPFLPNTQRAFDRLTYTQRKFVRPCDVRFLLCFRRRGSLRAATIFVHLTIAGSCRTHKWRFSHAQAFASFQSRKGLTLTTSKPTSCWLFTDWRTRSTSRSLARKPTAGSRVEHWQDSSRGAVASATGTNRAQTEFAGYLRRRSHHCRADLRVVSERDVIQGDREDS